MSSSGESSASSSRSSTPEPITQKNEGDDPHWAFEPPAGAVAIDNTTVSVGHFDWDAVHADEDAEVWLIRVPEGVKAKHLEGAVLDAKSLSTSSPHNVRYWSVGDAAEEENADPEAAAATPAGGEEIARSPAYSPGRRRRGSLSRCVDLSPKPIARHIVLSARELQPTAPPSTIPLQNPPRQSYPEDMLTHKFMPYGSLMATGDIDEDVAMDEPMRRSPPSLTRMARRRRRRRRRRSGRRRARRQRRRISGSILRS
ncbi:hypothetical protein BD626DRAFT_513633 [Schizophyllum amplum]|uniref:Uncharacterized protein n=1 Tax=Schizophyllum amplum TaxID=97359 RepID=A0A550BZ90_9AGAR|nr:hypothetical protein BD626DRAFT_513633 [Auriculariopsis ampla]